MTIGRLADLGKVRFHLETTSAQIGETISWRKRTLPKSARRFPGENGPCPNRRADFLAKTDLARIGEVVPQSKTKGVPIGEDISCTKWTVSRSARRLPRATWTSSRSERTETCMLVCLDVDYRDEFAVAACLTFSDWQDSRPVRELTEVVREVEPYRPRGVLSPRASLPDAGARPLGRAAVDRPHRRLRLARSGEGRSWSTSPSGPRRPSTDCRNSQDAFRRRHAGQRSRARPKQPSALCQRDRSRCRRGGGESTDDARSASPADPVEEGRPVVPRSFSRRFGSSLRLTSPSSAMAVSRPPRSQTSSGPAAASAEVCFPPRGTAIRAVRKPTFPRRNRKGSGISRSPAGERPLGN
jgi:hypothetical protein